MSHGRSAHAEAATLGLLYAALAMLAIALARQPGSIAIVWFANGAAMAFFVTSPRSRWPLLAAALVVASAGANLAFGDRGPQVAVLAASNAADVLLAALLVRRLRFSPWPFNGPVELLKLLGACAVLAPLASASLAASGFAMLGLGSFDKIWADWFVGAAVGTVITLPAALAWRHEGWRTALRQVATLRVAALVLATVLIALVALSSLPYPFVYLVQAPIVAAFLAPPAAALTVGFVLGVSATMSMAFGVFAPAGAAATAHPVFVYLPALLAVLPAQMLIVALARDRALSNVLASISSGATDLMLVFDLRGTVRAVNAAWLKSIGRTQAEVIGRHWTQALAPGVYNAGMQARVDRALGGETLSARVTVPFGRGERRTMDVSYQPSHGADRQRNGVIWTVHDVSDLMRTQAELQRGMAELQRANEQLEQFARIASHDLREPLNTIAQFSELIEEDHGAQMPPEVRGYFDHLKRGAARMRTMLDDMLQLARLQRPGEAALAPVALDAVLAQALAALRARIDARGAAVHAEPLPTVLGQPSALALLLQNLIGNAVKFVPPERVPQVRVSARRERDGAGEWVLVGIEDNGVGIDAKHLATVFEPFKRLHSRRKFDGTGLGLTISRRIAETLGGTITVESRPGEGSRFELRLRAA
ncbi:MAG TPA: ATP-binding protein [Methylibium sp.]|uniref:ATP-binding protein n=1 Tax=Methylibium sp. TaxID=2067992 RepID=UPI002DB6AA97|nr:ATP-binding protein [Methylibium sp.]HEU4457987.1 ATP-binding protein [Methylibium sp.]